MATAIRPQRLRLPSPALALRAAGVGLTGAGCAAIFGAVCWLVVAASERTSPLSPPTLRTPAAWLLGPLQGLMPGLSRSTTQLNADLITVVVVAAVGWLLVWTVAPAVRTRVLLGVSAAAQVVLVLGPPLSLTDVFNYELYGRMAALHGLNPYRALPAAASTDPTFLLSNWHHLSSPYGPLFTAFSELLVPFGAHGWLWAWKIVELGCGIGVVTLIGAIAGQLGASRQRAVACFGLSPLFLIYEVGALHNDLPALLCVLGAVWCMLRSRGDDAPSWVDPVSGALVVAAAGIKPSFAIVVGIVVFGASNRPRAIAGAAAAGLFAIAVTVLLYGGALPDVKAQGMLVTPLSIPNLLGLAIGHGGADAAVRSAAQDVMLLASVAATVAVAWRREWAVSAAGVVLLVAVLTLPWVMCWYLLWALPFVAVGKPRLLAPVMVFATVWLIVGSSPQLPQIIHGLGYFPTRLPTGLANHREFVSLVK